MIDTLFWYYVANPSLGINAGVHAPSAEKARTTYLDYLERTGKIARGDRQFQRKQTLAQRVDIFDESQVDIKLDYDYIEEAEPVMNVGSYQPQVYEEPAVVEPEAGSTEGMSPLQRLVLTGKVD